MMSNLHKIGDFGKSVYSSYYRLLLNTNTSSLVLDDADIVM